MSVIVDILPSQLVIKKPVYNLLAVFVTTEGRNQSLKQALEQTLSSSHAPSLLILQL